MPKKRKSNDRSVQPGMEVEATRGDLGEADVSKPKVSDVARDVRGNVEKFTVEKGVVFKKKLEVPADRIQSVDRPAEGDKRQGKVLIEVSKQEADALTAVGDEELTSEKSGDLLEEVGKEIPTAEALRELEAAANARSKKGRELPFQVEEKVLQTTGVERKTPAKSRSHNFLLSILGPGFLAGMAGNDASAVATYSVDGAANGFGHLWLLLLSTPLYQAVQFACARLGQTTQMGFAEVLRTHYSRWIGIPATLVLLIANVALIAADLVAIGSGLELITGVPWAWFVVPVGGILWYITVYRNFDSIKKIFIAMSLGFVTYLITAVFSRANVGAVLFNTFVPHLDFSFASVSSAVALLGATVSPYNMYWQVQGEKEEKRAGTKRQKERRAALDIAIGVISGNLVAYFIIICTAATLFAHHQSVTTAADAARSLEPLLGPFAKYLFAIGFIGAGLVAIPVLLASTSYAVAGTFGWPAGLSKKPWQNEGFYLILTVSLAVSLIIALLRFSPIQLIFWANVLSGVLAPLLVVYLIIMGNNRRIMRGQRIGIMTNIGLIVTALVMFAAAFLLFYGLATGQSS